jgi:hypothetical protein
MLDYGYRSRCCYAPIRLGTKKIKNTNLTKRVWICVRCKKSDVPIVEYTKDETLGSSPKKEVIHKFASDDEIEIQNGDEED